MPIKKKKKKKENIEDRPLYSNIYYMRIKSSKYL